MARNRERAQDRKRRSRDGNGDDATTPEDLHADQQPINASGEVDELEATVARDGDPYEEAERELDEPDPELEQAAMSQEPPAEVAVERAPERTPTTGGGPRAWLFLKASWKELQAVQWPDRKQVAQATAVVLGFVVIAGAYLGLADAAAKWVVDQII